MAMTERGVEIEQRVDDGEGGSVAADASTDDSKLCSEEKESTGRKELKSETTCSRVCGSGESSRNAGGRCHPSCMPQHLPSIVLFEPCVRWAKR